MTQELQAAYARGMERAAEILEQHAVSYQELQHLANQAKDLQSALVHLSEKQVLLIARKEILDEVRRGT
jgi:uncharacterized membrane-anchored protein YhcB (DUF1043 family)